MNYYNLLQFNQSSTNIVQWWVGYLFIYLPLLGFFLGACSLAKEAFFDHSISFLPIVNNFLAGPFGFFVQPDCLAFLILYKIFCTNFLCSNLVFVTTWCQTLGLRSEAIVISLNLMFSSIQCCSPLVVGVNKHRGVFVNVGLM